MNVIQSEVSIDRSFVFIFWNKGNLVPGWNERTKGNVGELTLVFFFAVLPWDAAGPWGGNYSRDGLHVELQPACLRGYYGRVLHLRRCVHACIVHFSRTFDASVYMYTHTCTYVYRVFHMILFYSLFVMEKMFQTKFTSFRGGQRL